MYNYYNPYMCYGNIPMYNDYNEYNCFRSIPSDFTRQQIKLQDYGPKPIVFNIEEATKQNNNFRTTLWTGKHLQLTLMSINPNESIGLEVHPNLDQFIRVEQGQGIVMLGDNKDNSNYKRVVSDDFAIIIPSGKYHNIINTGNIPLKLYSIYAPPEHPYNTVHKTKKDSEEDEHDLGNT